MLNINPNLSVKENSITLRLICYDINNGIFKCNIVDGAYNNFLDLHKSKLIN